MYLITVKGLVQGVGFRPYIYRKAVSLGEKGFVRNTGSGVEIMVSSPDFQNKLSDLPSLAEIHESHVRELSPDEEAALVQELDLDLSQFSIVRSSQKKGAIFIPPDISVCQDCLGELESPKDRRHGYYFITCTNCGPRFSMMRDFTQAYDRPHTAMDDFPMCEDCNREYTDPLDRRYHAQTIACPHCGPKLRFYQAGEALANGPEAIAEAVLELEAGRVVAVKGNGGYHLCCLVFEEAVSELRRLSGRLKKPYALLMRDLEMARNYVEVDRVEEELLLTLQRPIVVLEKCGELRGEGKTAQDFRAVSELSSLGVMLPYTALHYLLSKALGRPLVLTSANLPGNPMATTLEEISKLCPLVLEHEREIVSRVDDSVVRVLGHPAFTSSRHQVFLRRARGWTPSKFTPAHPAFCRYLEEGGKDALALGAMKNNAIAYLSRDGIFLSHYLGNSENLGVFSYLQKVTSSFSDIAGARPGVVVCDLHPDFNTTQMAEEMAQEEDLRLVRVQHHLAHACGAALEHGLEDWTAIVCDGVGYGSDGKPWGGELFRGCRRVGSLEEQPMVGGDGAARDNLRMLFGILSKFLSEEGLAGMGLFPDASFVWHQQLASGFNIHQTTSTGRVLDAAAALLGLSQENHYEGRAPMLLESAALHYLRSFGGRAPGFAVGEGHGQGPEPDMVMEDRLILRTTPLFRYLHGAVLETSGAPAGTPWREHLARAEKKESGIIGRLALETHLYLASGLYQMAEKVRGDSVLTFSGGVAANTLFSGFLSSRGVLLHREVPPGDGGIAFGQLAYHLLFQE